MLQFLLNWSDLQAAETVRCRIDFKYAPALELDDPGFHHSVLSDFRERVAEGDRADRLLDPAPTRLKEAELVCERTTQRTDSTHVLASVRSLTRPQLVTEAVRAAWKYSPTPTYTCWSTRSEGAATAVRSARASTPPGPRPGSTPPATTPSGCWSISASTGQTARSALKSKLCGTSSCRTTTATRQTACAGTPTRAADCRPRVAIVPPTT
ncbi:transposase [Streptomyces mirabilis]|uniref:transposase n=1 Tax=Streptomyces mirabilis TaxID=68239 RepID=UPI0036CEE7AC